MTKDPKTPEVVAKVWTDIEAGVMVGALEARGITAQAVGGLTAGFRTETPSMISVVVAASDLAAAQRILEEVRADDEEIDWSNVDVGKPEE